MKYRLAESDFSSIARFWLHLCNQKGPKMTDNSSRCCPRDGCIPDLARLAFGLTTSMSKAIPPTPAHSPSKWQNVGQRVGLLHFVVAAVAQSDQRIVL